MLILRTAALLGALLLAGAAHAEPSSQPASRPATEPSASQPAPRPAHIQPAHLRILFQNRMGSLYTLVKLEVVLDGVYVYKRMDDQGGLDRPKILTIYDGAVAPVAHRVAVKLIYRGKSLGLFTYRHQYIYTLRDAHPVKAGPGSRTTITIRGYRRGNIFWRAVSRMAVQFEEPKAGAKRAPASTKAP